MKAEVITLKGSPLSEAFSPEPPRQVNNWSQPTYVAQQNKEIICTDQRQCSDKWEELKGTHCAPAFKLHRIRYSDIDHRLDCRKVTGYQQKTIRNWIRN